MLSREISGTGRAVDAKGRESARRLRSSEKPFWHDPLLAVTRPKPVCAFTANILNLAR
jgi:hypothetical protein